MKTRTNFQKTVIRSAAVVVSFVLVSFTVSAQGFWKKLLTNSSINEVALALVEPEAKNHNYLKVSKIDWNLFDQAFDPVLDLEDWMLGQSHFSPSKLDMKSERHSVNRIREDVPDKDEQLILDAWMIQDDVWNRMKN